MTALAFLAVTRAQVTDPTTGVGGGGGDRPGRAGRALRRRAASAAGRPGLAPTGRSRVPAGLVALATTPSGHRSTRPLPATTQQTATVGLRPDQKARTRRCI